MKPSALQVLFEPWPASAGADRDGYEAFAGHYLLDALTPEGVMKVRGFRAVVSGCTTCRRDAKDGKMHVPNINDMKPEGPRRKCPQWKRVEAIVDVRRARRSGARVRGSGGPDRRGMTAAQRRAR